jgi:hypothetical protein
MAVHAHHSRLAAFRLDFSCNKSCGRSFGFRRRGSRKAAQTAIEKFKPAVLIVPVARRAAALAGS